MQTHINPDFIEFVSSLSDSFKIPKRTTMRIDILNVYELFKGYLIDKFKNVCNSSKVSITIDGWTSNTNTHFIGITVHCTEDWNLNTYVLGFKHLKENHSAINIADAVEEIITEFGLKENVFCLTTDNENTMTSVKTLLQQRGIIDFHRGCAPHTLNLIVKAGLKVLNSRNDSIPKIRTFAKKLHTYTLYLSTFNWY
ncbi:hypothetical protein GEMRC1_011348 [Eukaryota sp. GEM-RC1]